MIRALLRRIFHRRAVAVPVDTDLGRVELVARTDVFGRTELAIEPEGGGELTKESFEKWAREGER